MPDVLVKHRGRYAGKRLAVVGAGYSAINVLLDLVTALSSDLPSNSVKYTLLTEQDMDLAPALKQGLADARAKVGRLLETSTP